MLLSCSKRTTIIFFILLEQKTNLNGIKKYVKIKLFVMRSCFSEDTKRVILNQYKISDKAPYTIYADLECLIENLEK